MSNTRVVTVLSALVVLTACGGGGPESPTPPAAGLPSTGLYASTQYTVAQLTEYKDVKYSTRPNGGGQFTSDRTKATEKTAPTLTLLMDIWVPPNARANRLQPMVIFIHGGGFVAGAKEDNRGKALSYAQAGYVAATINYRLTPNNDVDAATRLQAMTQAADDVANAVRYLKAQAATYFIDTTRMATIGGSAGGALSLTNAIAGDELAGTVSDYPGVSAQVAAAVSTGATLIDSLVDTTPLLRYDATDSPVQLFHANPTDPVTAATWAGHVLVTQQRINASGNSCVVVDHGSGHTVDLDLGGAWWPTVQGFLWPRLRLAALR
ncbi:MAG: alpha/beta hydrolase [Ideonella sp.]|nr:alpha/beta hydrolase [Ideonella sp.]